MQVHFGAIDGTLVLKQALSNHPLIPDPRNPNKKPDVELQQAALRTLDTFAQYPSVLDALKQGPPVFYLAMERWTDGKPTLVLDIKRPDRFFDEWNPVTGRLETNPLHRRALAYWGQYSNEQDKDPLRVVKQPLAYWPMEYIEQAGKAGQYGYTQNLNIIGQEIDQYTTLFQKLTAGDKDNEKFWTPGELTETVNPFRNLIA
jgi:hypothetical protein